jgi:hypothetical protein
MVDSVVARSSASSVGLKNGTVAPAFFAAVAISALSVETMTWSITPDSIAWRIGLAISGSPSSDLRFLSGKPFEPARAQMIPITRLLSITPQL